MKSNKDIDRKHAQSTFVGPGGSGKTTFMCRLIHKRQLHHTSTGVATSVKQVDVDIGSASKFCSVDVLDSNTWEEVKFDKSLVSQMQEISRTVPQKHTSVKTSKASPRTPVESSTASLTASTKSNITADFDTAVFTSKVSSQSSGQFATIPFTSIEPEITEVLSTTFKRHGGCTNFYHFWKKTFSFYMRDAGGQVEFQELVSLLIIGPSIFFFIFRADLGLKSTFQVGYRTSATESINCYTSSITTEEALLQCLSSVYAMDTPTQAGHSSPNPHVFIVATHKDKLGSSADQKIQQLNEDVKSLIEKSGFKHLVQYADIAEGQVMFVVDNMSESDNDFQPIRSQVHDLVVSRDEFTVNYRFSYLLFSLEFQNDQRNVLTLEECRVMAAKYKITGDKVFDLLYFLHQRLGLIHFVNIKGVKCVAMKRPEDLFNQVTDLVVKTFSPKAVNIKEADDLTKGIFTASAFKRVVCKDDTFTADEFLKILIHLRILAEIVNEDHREKKYFLPCVLNHVQEFTGAELETCVMPLSLKFKCKHCPKGLFGVLVTHLMSTNTQSSGISFSLREDKIFKEQVSFYVKSSGEKDTVSLKFSTHQLKISFYPELSEDRETPISSVCSKVREIISQSIISSLESLHYSRANVEPVLCMECAQCFELHEVMVGQKHIKIHCDTGNQGIVLPPQAGYWWGEWISYHVLME